MKRRKRFVRLVFVAILGTSTAASAENWPAWRGDGSGTSSETGIAESWSTTQNIKWKTEIPGHGHSSPIVWEDLVFLTTSVEGVQREMTRTVAFVMVLVLAFTSVWWCLDTIFRHPLDPHAEPLSKQSLSRTRRALRKTLLFVIYIVAGCCALLAWRRALGGIPPAKYIWASTGVFSALIVLGLNRLLDARAPPLRTVPTTPRSDSLMLRVMLPIQAILILVVVASFVAVILLDTLLNPCEYTYLRAWMEDSLICSIGVIAAVGSFPPGSRWRLAGTLIGVVVTGIFLWGPPDAPLLWYTKRGLRLYTYMTLFAATFASLGWFALQHFQFRRRSRASVMPHGLSAILGPSAMLLLVLVQFLSNHVLMPRAAILRQVVCLDRKSGEFLWKATCDVGSLGLVHTANSPATPTPTTDGEHVYAHFGVAGTYCLDLKGNIVWKHTEPLPEIHWGAASSPILWEHVLLVTHDADTQSLTFALDKNTGTKLWEAKRGRPKGSSRSGDNYGSLDGYSTPRIVESAGGPQLVHYGNRRATGYDPRTGEELWVLPQPSTQIVACPMVWKDLVILTCGGDIPPFHMTALRLDQEGRGRMPETIWEVTKRLPQVSSPVVYGEHIYAVTDGGIATCREAGSGGLVWKKRLPGRYSASVAAADGKVFFCNEDGVTTVVAADAEVKVLSSNPIEELVMASMAISQSEIYIRGQRHLFCIAGNGAIDGNE